MHVWHVRFFAATKAAAIRILQFGGGNEHSAIQRDLAKAPAWIQKLLIERVVMLEPSVPKIHANPDEKPENFGIEISTAGTTDNQMTSIDHLRVTWVRLVRE